MEAGGEIEREAQRSENGCIDASAQLLSALKWYNIRLRAGRERMFIASAPFGRQTAPGLKVQLTGLWGGADARAVAVLGPPVGAGCEGEGWGAYLPDGDAVLAPNLAPGDFAVATTARESPEPYVPSVRANFPLRDYSVGEAVLLRYPPPRERRGKERVSGRGPPPPIPCEATPERLCRALAEPVPSAAAAAAPPRAGGRSPLDRLTAAHFTWADTTTGFMPKSRRRTAAARAEPQWNRAALSAAVSLARHVSRLATEMVGDVNGERYALAEDAPVAIRVLMRRGERPDPEWLLDPGPARLVLYSPDRSAEVWLVELGGRPPGEPVELRLEEAEGSPEFERLSAALVVAAGETQPRRYEDVAIHVVGGGLRMDSPIDRKLLLVPLPAVAAPPPGGPRAEVRAGPAARRTTRPSLPTEGPRAPLPAPFPAEPLARRERIRPPAPVPAPLPFPVPVPVPEPSAIPVPPPSVRRPAAGPSDREAVRALVDALLAGTSPRSITPAGVPSGPSAPALSLTALQFDRATGAVGFTSAPDLPASDRVARFYALTWNGDVEPLQAGEPVVLPVSLSGGAGTGFGTEGEAVEGGEAEGEGEGEGEGFLGPDGALLYTPLYGEAGRETRPATPGAVLDALRMAGRRPEDGSYSFIASLPFARPAPGTSDPAAALAAALLDAIVALTAAPERWTSADGGRTFALPAAGTPLLVEVSAQPPPADVDAAWRRAWTGRALVAGTQDRASGIWEVRCSNPPSRGGRSRARVPFVSATVEVPVEPEYADAALEQLARMADCFLRNTRLQPGRLSLRALGSGLRLVRE